MRYQVIVEVIADDETGKTEWILGGNFYRKQLAELFARGYEQSNRATGLEAIVVDTDNVKYADTDSVKNLKKQKLNSLYGMYARGDI